MKDLTEVLGAVRAATEALRTFGLNRQDLFYLEPLAASSFVELDEAILALRLVFTDTFRINDTPAGTLTSEEYVRLQNSQQTCPYCYSERCESQGVYENAGFVLTIASFCHRCNLQWDEVYLLNGWSPKRTLTESELLALVALRGDDDQDRSG